MDDASVGVGKGGSSVGGELGSSTPATTSGPSCSKKV